MANMVQNMESVEENCSNPVHFVKLPSLLQIAFQTTFGPTIMPQPELLHPEAADVLEPLILLAHSLGILVNLLLGKKRHFWFQ